MKTLKNMTKVITALVFILTLTVTTLSISLPVNAVVEQTIGPFMSVFPNPIGVSQTVTINVFTQPLPPSSNDRFFDLKVTMTKPDGTTQTFGPSVSGPLGNAIWTYVPTEVGTYKFQFSIPDQDFSEQYDIKFLGATGPEVDLVVQPNPVVGFPDISKSEEFWDFPINAQNRLWADNMGPWLQASYDHTGSKYNPYTTGPKTAHIVWTWRNALGGLEGADFGAVAYAQGRAYESKNTPQISINNIYYQYGPIGDRVTAPHNLNAIDMTTGKVIWSKPIESAGVGVGTVALYGQIYRHDSVNQVGLHAYLWQLTGTEWRMFDAFTGDWIMSLTNVTTGGASGKMVLEKTTGRMFYYMINTRDGWMAMWNQTKCWDQSTARSGGVFTYQSDEIRAANGVYGSQFRPRDGAENDWRKGIQWNVTIPSEKEWMDPTQMATLRLIDDVQGVAVCLWPGDRFDPYLTPKSITQAYGYSLDNSNPRKLFGPINVTVAMTTTSAIGEDLYILGDPNNRTYIAYDLQTGAKRWDSDQMSYPWGSYFSLGPTLCNDKLYASCYDGFWCFDAETGEEVWQFSAGNAGIETPYGTWVGRSGGNAIGGGFVYWITGVWHPSAVMHRGDRLFCLEWNKGDHIWNITGMYEPPLLANGYLIAHNLYDNTVYCFSKGSSATTVEASPKVVARGSAVLIEGTVTDQSPAAKELVEKGRFNMIPAIADTDMSPWMEYLYMDQPQPTSANGVPVYLTAIRSDGTEIDLGYVISSINGNYHYLWTPPAQDTYRIVATFKGTDAYWPSVAETSLGVAGSPATPIEPEPIVEAPFISIEAAIVAVVAVAFVIGVVSYWVLKKRK